MDIDRFNFWEQLPTILEAICESLYVAVDLELSGIQVHTSRPKAAPKPTLQEAYNTAREAADRYTILQFGLSCINWDPDKRSYVIKTFNIPLHPGVVVDDLHSAWLSSTVNRCVSISTSSLGFLEGNGFNTSDVFQKGVPYLSLAELSTKEMCDFMLGNRPADEDLFDVANLPRSSMEFRNKVKWKISAWRAQVPSGPGPWSVRIFGRSGHRLNGLQKRLVHQLLQDQFPDLVAVSRDRGSYLEVHNRDMELDRDMGERTRTVSKQTGARILWDAICGRDFTNSIFAGNFGTDRFRCVQMKTQVEQYESRLRKKRPILVGHNILLDLCFLHSSFVGDLPGTVQEFRATTRKVHPRIVDTKYLFTRGGDEMSPDYSLGECFAAIRDQQLPAVVPSPSRAYSESLDHQAGYDSYMTAIVFLKKSYQLAQAREGLWYIPSEDLGENEVISSSSISHASPLPGRWAPVLLKKCDGATTTFSLLEECDEYMAALTAWTPLEPSRPAKAPLTAPQTPELSPWLRSKITALEAGRIPEWGGQFWGKYANRTRVGPFGLVLYMPTMAGETGSGDEK